MDKFSCKKGFLCSNVNEIRFHRVHESCRARYNAEAKAASPNCSSPIDTPQKMIAWRVYTPSECMEEDHMLVCARTEYCGDTSWYCWHDSDLSWGHSVICWCVGRTGTGHMLMRWQNSDPCLTTLQTYAGVLELLGLAICLCVGRNRTCV